MALIDRLKVRTETDLTDAELAFIILEIQADIEKRYGINGSITVHVGYDRELDGSRTFLTLARPFASSETITEIDGTTETVLASNDYRFLHGGRTIERLADGTNGREFWQRLVKVVYTPLDDSKERDEITIKVATMDIDYRGLKSEKAGDYSAAFLDYDNERTALLNRLAPRPGLLMA